MRKLPRAKERQEFLTLDCVGWGYRVLVSAPTTLLCSPFDSGAGPGTVSPLPAGIRRSVVRCWRVQEEGLLCLVRLCQLVSTVPRGQQHMAAPLQVVSGESGIAQRAASGEVQQHQAWELFPSQTL